VEVDAMDGKYGKYPRGNPVPLLPELRQYPGKWVATKDHKVVAVADTPLELVHKVKALGLAGQALSQYIPADDDVITIGLG
jgi:hypothetical protein